MNKACDTCDSKFISFTGCCDATQEECNFEYSGWVPKEPRRSLMETQRELNNAVIISAELPGLSTTENAKRSQELLE